MRKPVINHAWVLTAVLFGILQCVMTGNALALRCGNRIVETGDRTHEVLRFCGAPYFINKWIDDTVLYRKEDGEELNIAFISTAYIEEWTYNFGSKEFIRFLRFVDGKLRKIDLGPKGFPGDTPEPSNRSRCGSLASRGDRKIEVLMQCGEPDIIEFFGEDRVSTALERLKREGVFKRHAVEVQVEEWTYNLGPLHFLIFIKFENGRVAKTELGDYGY